MDQFSAIVTELRGIVRLLETVPPLEDGEGLRRALERLAAAIDNIPGPPQPARAEATRLMRQRDFEVWVALEREGAKAEHVREVLAIAAGALMLTVDGPYADAPELKTSVERFKREAFRIDPNKPVTEERPAILAALQAGVRALELVRAAAPRVVTAKT